MQRQIKIKGVLIVDSNIIISDSHTTELSIESSGVLQTSSPTEKTILIDNGCYNINGTLCTMGNGDLIISATGAETPLNEKCSKGLFIGPTFTTHKIGTGNISIKTNGENTPIVINEDTNLKTNSDTQLTIGTNATKNVLDIKSGATLNLSSLVFE